MNKQWTAVFIR